MLIIEEAYVEGACKEELIAVKRDNFEKILNGYPVPPISESALTFLQGPTGLQRPTDGGDMS